MILDITKTRIANIPERNDQTITAFVIRCGKNQVFTERVASGNNVNVSFAEGRNMIAENVAVIRNTTIKFIFPAILRFVVLIIGNTFASLKYGILYIKDVIGTSIAKDAISDIVVNTSLICHT